MGFDLLLNGCKVALVARPQFLGVPVDEMGAPRNDQDLGTDGERLIEASGRVCYDSMGSGRSSTMFHKHLQEVGHGSVLQHAQWTFLITGDSRGLTHELVRHHAGTAVSQRSTRYVDECDSPWVIPPLFLDREGDREEVRVFKEEARALIGSTRFFVADAYRRLTTLGQRIMGGPPASVRKVVRGAARSVLGQALEAPIMFSANAQALIHIAHARCNDAADAEICRMAAKFIEIMRVELPLYFGEVRLVPRTDGLGVCLDHASLTKMQSY